MKRAEASTTAEGREPVGEELATKIETEKRKNERRFKLNGGTCK